MRIVRMGARGHQQQIRHACLALVFTQPADGLGGEDLHPGIRVGEQGAELWAAGIGTWPEICERFAGTIAGVGVGAVEQVQQVRQEVFLLVAEHGFGLAFTPAQHGELPATFAGLGGGDGFGEFDAGVAGEFSATHAQDHITGGEHPIGGGALGHGRDQNLACIPRVAVGGENPAPCSRRAKRPVVRCTRLPALGEVGNRRGRQAARRHRGDSNQRWE